MAEGLSLETSDSDDGFHEEYAIDLQEHPGVGQHAKVEETLNEFPPVRNIEDNNIEDNMLRNNDEKDNHLRNNDVDHNQFRNKKFRSNGDKDNELRNNGCEGDMFRSDKFGDGQLRIKDPCYIPLEPFSINQVRSVLLAQIECPRIFRNEQYCDINVDAESHKDVTHKTRRIPRLNQPIFPPEIENDLCDRLDRMLRSEQNDTVELLLHVPQNEGYENKDPSLPCCSNLEVFNNEHLSVAKTVNTDTNTPSPTEPKKTSDNISEDETDFLEYLMTENNRIEIFQVSSDESDVALDLNLRPTEESSQSVKNEPQPQRIERRIPSSCMLNETVTTPVDFKNSAPESPKSASQDEPKTSLTANPNSDIKDRQSTSSTKRRKGRVTAGPCPKLRKRCTSETDGETVPVRYRPRSSSADSENIDEVILMQKRKRRTYKSVESSLGANNKKKFKSKEEF